MKSLKMLTAALSALLVVGCNTEYNGVMSLKEPLLANGKKSQFIVPAGDLSLRVLLKSKKEVHLLVKSPIKEERIRLISKTDLAFPSYGGDILIPGAQVGQPFNIAAHVDYDSQNSSEAYRVESCSKQVEVRICKLQPDNTEICRRELRSVYGRQEVRYYTNVETRILTASIHALDNNRVLGTMNSRNYESTDIVTGRSPCVLDRAPGLDIIDSGIGGGTIVLGH